MYLHSSVSVRVGESRPWLQCVFEMTCFFESNSFEDCIRNAVSVGGDTDTICAIAGSVAEAYFEIPNEIKDAALRVLDPKLASLLNRFYSIIKTENQ